MTCKKFFLLSLILLAAFSVQADDNTYSFKPTSRLESGRWVKVEIDKTGLYQISYEQLREMGFEIPEKVGVYGRGGALLPTNFSTTTDEEAYNDDLSPMAVIHDNNSLYFVARNTESISFTPGNAPRFNRGLSNLYSISSYYFLSDSENPVVAEICNSDASESLDSGWDFIYHELDLQQNTSNTGQVFWGENYLDNASMQWDLSLPLNAGGTARVSTRFYTNIHQTGTVGITLGNTTKSYNYTSSNSSSASEIFCVVPSVLTTTPAEISINDNQSQSLTISASGADPDFLNLDYWIVTYNKRLPKGDSLGENAAERYRFNTIENTVYSLALDQNLRLIDISNPSAIKIAGRSISNPDNVNIQAAASSADVIIYDPRRSQMNIKSWKVVDNQNLHALQENGIDMLIVSTPIFKGYAEQLADIHKKHQNLDIAVVTPEEIYNEFSAGVPDPMAYRALSKMIYQRNPEKYKNILLFGPSDRNLRREVEGETKFDRIIAYQQIDVTPERDASPAYDFYGIIDNTINEHNLYNEDMKIGVGLLSCETDTECQRILRKIEHYLTDDTQAWRVNETLSIGGLGNSHAHDQQAEKYGGLIRAFSNLSGMAHNTIAIDAYGNEEARERVINAFNSGKNFTAYFGHGGPAMFGQDKKFFTTAEAVNMRNPNPGFIFLGGCEFSIPDARSRGLGETFILDNDNGMIGAIVSTRSAWSNQNYDLGKRFLESWLAYPVTETSPTIGEIYARAKSGKSGLGSNVANAMTFVLAGDPALKVPTPVRRVNMTAPEQVSPGEKIRIEGVVNYKGAELLPDENFNGKVVLKLMQPSVVLRSMDYVTDSKSSGEYLDVTYDSERMTAVEGIIENGVFSVDMVIPSDASDFTGKEVRLTAGVFDTSRWLGGSGAVIMTVSESTSENAVIDMDAPTLNLTYDASRQVVIINGMDETAMYVSAAGYAAKLDGKPVALNDEYICESGETGNSMTGYVDVRNLSNGRHTISVTTSDLAGNSVSSEIEFEKIADTAPLLLYASKKAVVDDVEISVEGDFSGALDFEIADSAGNVVMKKTSAASSLFWDCTDNNGKRVPEGLYRARVRSAVGADRTLYSEWITFAVFD